MQDQAKLLNEVDIVKSINALCIIARDSEIPYNTQDQKNETQHPQFITEGTVPSSVLLMYKLACEQTLLLREVTRERHARSLATWLASLATHCVGIAWHRHQRDCWNKTEHYYTHCAHLIPKRKACLQVTVTRRCLSCCYFSYYGCLPFFCELSCLNAQLKHFFPFFSAGSQLHSKRSCDWSQLRKSRSANECSAWKVRDQGTVIEIKKREPKLVSW